MHFWKLNFKSNPKSSPKGAGQPTAAAGVHTSSTASTTLTTTGSENSPDHHGGNRDSKDKKSMNISLQGRPRKGWVRASYYESAGFAELQKLVTEQAPPILSKRTASTEESSTWAESLMQRLKDQEKKSSSYASLGMQEAASEEGDASDGGDDAEDTDYYMTPEGITRVPFMPWEMDLLGTSKLSSYFQGNTVHEIKAKTRGFGSRGPTLSYRSLYHHSGYAADTPLNSPRPPDSPW
mmetsp:Transcript_2407/g.3774  ORF Transcript_2407/g.3774 Transcript_2407/m.3774 type:complete len:237 (-) Transcript_2407:103-813(-)